jgi:predicted Rdx family selenoprotein
VEAEVKADFGDAQVELVEGDDGVFDVVVDGKTVFSRGGDFGKRFPRVGETSDLIRREIGV